MCSNIDKQINKFTSSDFQTNCNLKSIQFSKSKKHCSTKQYRLVRCNSTVPHWPFKNNLNVDFIHIDKTYIDTTAHNDDDPWNYLPTYDDISTRNTHSNTCTKNTNMTLKHV